MPPLDSSDTETDDDAQVPPMIHEKTPDPPSPFVSGLREQAMDLSSSGSYQPVEEITELERSLEEFGDLPPEQQQLAGTPCEWPEQWGLTPGAARVVACCMHPERDAARLDSEEYQDMMRQLEDATPICEESVSGMEETARRVRSATRAARYTQVALRLIRAGRAEEALHVLGRLDQLYMMVETAKDQRVKHAENCILIAWVHMLEGGPTRDVREASTQFERARDMLRSFKPSLKADPMFVTQLQLRLAAADHALALMRMEQGEDERSESLMADARVLYERLEEAGRVEARRVDRNLARLKLRRIEDWAQRATRDQELQASARMIAEEAYEEVLQVQAEIVMSDPDIRLGQKPLHLEALRKVAQAEYWRAYGSAMHWSEQRLKQEMLERNKLYDLRTHAEEEARCAQERGARHDTSQVQQFITQSGLRLCYTNSFGHGTSWWLPKGRQRC